MCVLALQLLLTSRLLRIQNQGKDATVSCFSKNRVLGRRTRGPGLRYRGWGGAARGGLRFLTTPPPLLCSAPSLMLRFAMNLDCLIVFALHCSWLVLGPTFVCFAEIGSASLFILHLHRDTHCALPELAPVLRCRRSLLGHLCSRLQVTHHAPIHSFIPPLPPLGALSRWLGPGGHSASHKFAAAAADMRKCPPRSVEMLLKRGDLLPQTWQQAWLALPGILFPPL